MISDELADRHGMALPADFKGYRDKGGGGLPPWYFLDDATAVDVKGLVDQRYERHAACLPFARSLASDDIVMFTPDGKVRPLHMYASEGWESVMEYASFRVWLREALEDCIDQLDQNRVRTMVRTEDERLSKAVSYALRHAPWVYELEPDAEGWVPLADLLDGLRREPEFAAVTGDDLARMIANSEKKRHELQDDRVRALYGHSLPVKLRKQLAVPPLVLYHGTIRASLPESWLTDFGRWGDSMCICRWTKRLPAR